MSPAALIALAAGRGVRLQVVGGALRCVSAGPLPDDLRDLLAARKQELLVHLGGRSITRGQTWAQGEANRLMEAADALVERLGTDGRLPAVQAAAAMVVSALAARDMETVRFAAGEFAAAVRAAALQKDPAAPQAT